jgi:hypothetical protein
LHDLVPKAVRIAVLARVCGPGDVVIIDERGKGRRMRKQ